MPPLRLSELHVVLQGLLVGHCNKRCKKRVGSNPALATKTPSLTGTNGQAFLLTDNPTDILPTKNFGVEGKSILKMVENRYRHRRKNDIKYMGKLISLPRKNGLRVKQCP